MSEQINWRQERDVYRNSEGETYVRVPGGYMELTDYTETGGQVYSQPEVGALQLVGRFTNAQLSNGIAV